MAWQPPNAMNNAAAGGGGPEHNAPAGTEYTLQGECRRAAAMIGDEPDKILWKGQR